MKPDDRRQAAALTARDAADRWSKREETVEEKISKLDTEVNKYKEQIKKMRPGPAQEVVKARAKRKLKQKRAYERQRDILYNRTFGASQVSSAKEKIKDSKQKVCGKCSNCGGDYEGKLLLRDSTHIASTACANTYPLASC